MHIAFYFILSRFNSVQFCRVVRSFTFFRDKHRLNGAV